VQFRQHGGWGFAGPGVVHPAGRRRGSRRPAKPAGAEYVAWLGSGGRRRRLWAGLVAGCSGVDWPDLLRIPVFAIPLAMVGWNSLRPQVLRAGLWLCVCSSLLSLVLNPERPLWPAGRVQQALAGSPRFNWLAKKMELYTLVPERARAGEALVQAIPASEPAVVVLVGEDHPLLPLFRPYSLGATSCCSRRMRFNGI